MQIYYMKKEKIPIPVSTVVLMIVTITYKLVLVVIGIGILIFGQGFLHRYLEGILPVYYLGLGLNVFCVVFMTVLVFHPVLTKEILKKGVHLLEKLRLMKHKEERPEKLDASMDTYRGTAVYLKEHMGVIVVVFGITFVQRMALFAATWFVYRAFGLSGTSFFDILFLQAVIAVAVDMLPLPGGMGISETLFLNIFRPVFGSLLLPGMVLSRGLGYYAELLISAAFTVVAQLTIGNAFFVLLQDIQSGLCSVWRFPDYAICLMERLRERRKTEQRMRSSSEFRLILCVMWSVLECFRLYYAMSWACAVFTVWQF